MENAVNCDLKLQTDSTEEILRSFTWLNATAKFKSCTLKVNLGFPRELRELHNDYHLAADKMKIKREILPNYQIKISDFSNFPISNVKKLVPNSFDKEKYVFRYQTLKLYLKLGVKLKKYTAY